jgi:hypothetical protein
MGALVDRWRSAKKLFKSTARVKKPSPTVERFASKTLGIEKALGKLDAALKTHHVGTDAKVYAAWNSAYKEFQVAKTSYMVVLDATVGKEPAGADKTAYRKGIAVLKTQLTALDKHLAAQTKGFKVAQEGVTNPVASLARQMKKGIAAGIAGAEAFIARVNANPTPAEFNGGIQTAARDITQYIGNINTLVQRGYPFAKAQPQALFKVLSSWANDGRVAPVNATPDQVLKELKLFEKAVAGVKAWAA